jgi:hypothetical protein
MNPTDPLQEAAASLAPEFNETYNPPSQPEFGTNMQFQSSKYETKIDGVEHCDQVIVNGNKLLNGSSNNEVS